MSNVLVIYYSRTGITRRVARELATLGDWDLEPVVDTKSRDGIIGYGRSLIDSLLGRTTTLAAVRHDIGDYDLVVVGTPVWNSSVSTPIRTWLQERAGRLPPLAFVATEGGRGAERAFRQMAAIAGREPLATIALTDREIDREPLGPRLAPLVAAIRAAVGAPHPSAPSPEPIPPALH